MECIPAEILYKLDLEIGDLVSLALTSKCMYDFISASDHIKCRSYTIYYEHSGMKTWSKHIVNKINIEEILKGLCEIGVGHQLLVEKYINFDLLHKDTIEFISKCLNDEKIHI